MIEEDMKNLLRELLMTDKLQYNEKNFIENVFAKYGVKKLDIVDKSFNMRKFFLPEDIILWKTKNYEYNNVCLDSSVMQDILESFDYVWTIISNRNMIHYIPENDEILAFWNDNVKIS